MEVIPITRKKTIRGIPINRCSFRRLRVRFAWILIGSLDIGIGKQAHKWSLARTVSQDKEKSTRAKHLVGTAGKLTAKLLFYQGMGT
jgi:hypothetical protein